MTKNKYRVHRFKEKGKDIFTELEQLLNNVDGEIISIIPNIKKDSVPLSYGGLKIHG